MKKGPGKKGNGYEAAADSVAKSKGLVRRAEKPGGRPVFGREQPTLLAGERQFKPVTLTENQRLAKTARDAAAKKAAPAVAKKATGGRAPKRPTMAQVHKPLAQRRSK